MHSIRLRIAMFVLAVVGVCQVGLSVYVLERLERVQRNSVDALLIEELQVIEPLIGTPELKTLVEFASRRNSKWDETFFEIRSLDGRVVAASDNVPPGGLGSMATPAEARPIQIWERLHPRTMKGHAWIRIAQATMNGHVVKVARSMKWYKSTYWKLRAQLAWGLVVVTVLVGLSALWVAGRSLAPVRQIAERAEALGASLVGELPHTGSGDELDQLAGVLNDLLSRIRDEIARTRRMTADAGHALRTPLTAIRGSLELRLRQADERDTQMLAPTLESIDDLIGIVNALLMLERIESGVGPQTTTVALDGLVEDLVDAFNVVAEDRKIRFECVSEPVTVRGDRDQLRNAIANLIDNALRHTPEGGRIDLSVCSAHGVASVTITDSGPGLRPDQLDRIFERFYTETSAGGSSGLGLPIARAIARAHGGSLTASSPGGARFELELPLWEAPA